MQRPSPADCSVYFVNLSNSDQTATGLLRNNGHSLRIHPIRQFQRFTRMQGLRSSLAE
jgi:hypothetical protein